MSDEAELEQCWWDGEPGEQAAVGKAGVIRMIIAPDGQGPMGWYDRIHVYNENGRHLVFPAHHVSGWSVKHGC